MAADSVALDISLAPLSMPQQANTSGQPRLEEPLAQRLARLQEEASRLALEQSQVAVCR